MKMTNSTKMSLTLKKGNGSQLRILSLALPDLRTAADIFRICKIKKGHFFQTEDPKIPLKIFNSNLYKK